MTKEIILEVGAEGGTLTLFGGKNATNAWEFWTKRDETAVYELLDEEDRASLGSPVHKSEVVIRLSEGLALLDRYPWFRLVPLQVHPEFRDAILLEVRKRGTPADEARWNERLDQ